MDDVTVRLLKSELAGWDHFIDALRADDKVVARAMIDRCMKFVEAIEQSGKEWLDQPFFLSILLAQEKQIRAFEGELETMRGVVDAWKTQRTPADLG